MLQAGKPSPTPPLFSTIEAYLQEQHPYTDQRYNIELLAKSLNKQEHDFQQQSKVRALQVSGNTLIIFDWNISDS